MPEENNHGDLIDRSDSLVSQGHSLAGLRGGGWPLQLGQSASGLGSKD